MSRISLTLLATLILLESGCSQSELTDAATGEDSGASFDGAPLPLPSLLFVGEDPTTRVTDIYGWSEDTELQNLTGEGVRPNLVSGVGVVAATSPLPSPSPDGRELALVITEPSTLEGEGAIRPCVLSLEQGGLACGEAVPHLAALTFTADGDWLVLQTRDSNSGTSQVKFVDPGFGSSSWGVDLDASDVQFQGFSPVDSHVLITATGPEGANRAVYSVDPATGFPVLLAWREDSPLDSPHISPDGQWVVVEASDMDGRRDLYGYPLLSSDSEGVLLSSGNPALDAHGAEWDPSSPSRLAFVEDAFFSDTAFTQLSVIPTMDSFEDADSSLLAAESLSPSQSLDALRWGPADSLASGLLLLVVKEVSAATGDSTESLLVMDVNSLEDDALTPLAYQEGTSPADASLAHWSRDGRRVLLWNRSESSEKEAASSVVEVDPHQGTATPVDTGFHGTLSYPLYAVENSLLYP